MTKETIEKVLAELNELKCSTEKEIEEIMCEVYKCISVNGENLNDLWGVDNLKEKEQENGQ